MIVNLSEATVEELKAKQEEMKKKMANFDSSYNKMNKSANDVANKLKGPNKSGPIFRGFFKK